MMEHGNWLSGTLVYLGAAVLAVPLAKKSNRTPADPRSKGYHDPPSCPYATA